MDEVRRFLPEPAHTQALNLPSIYAEMASDSSDSHEESGGGSDDDQNAQSGWVLWRQKMVAYSPQGCPR